MKVVAIAAALVLCQPAPAAELTVVNETKEAVAIKVIDRGTEKVACEFDLPAGGRKSVTVKEPAYRVELYEYRKGKKAGPLAVLACDSPETVAVKSNWRIERSPPK